MNAAVDAVGADESPVLVFTDVAATKVGELIRDEGNPDLKLRVFVSGGESVARGEHVAGVEAHAHAIAARGSPEDVREVLEPPAEVRPLAGGGL